jgi:subtilisin family serine protease
VAVWALLAVAAAWGMATDVPAKADKVSNKMWRIKTNGDISSFTRSVHYDTAHHLGSMSTSAAARLRQNPAVESVEEFEPEKKHKIDIRGLDTDQTLQLHSLHLNTRGEWPESPVAFLVSKGKKTAVWECASVAWSTCIRWVSQLHHVYYVEAMQKSQFRLMNAWSSGVTQSGEAHTTPLWAEGITGVGQIVGCGDTGIDIDSCMYWDTDKPRFAFDTLQPDNRKIIKYISSFGDKGDGAYGHGSHVTGSITGKAISLDGHAAAGVSNFNGMAPDAKLIFTDVQASGGGRGLNIPDSLDGSDGGDGLLPIPYADGARIHSNSWGSSSAAYTLYAQQIDSFVYDNPDMLVLVAAGNSGEQGVFSVGSPATCKNCLGIGATQNAQPAYEYVQMAVEMHIVLPEVCDLNHTTSTNLTFEAVSASFSSKVDTQLHGGIVMASPRDGCTELTGGGYAGRFVMMERGTCYFAEKVLHAQKAGAHAVLVTQNTDAPPFAMGGTPTEEITIEAVMISKAAGVTLQKRSDQCALVQHEYEAGGANGWHTVDSTPPPGLTSGLWSGASVKKELNTTSGNITEDLSCISFNCHTVNSDTTSSCSGWEDPMGEDGVCNSTGRVTFDVQFTSEGLIGFDVNILVVSVGRETFDPPIVSRAIGRWKDALLDIVMINFACAADPWCPNTDDRPVHFEPGPGGNVEHLHMLYRPNDEPITNLIDNEELADFIRDNLDSAQLFEGIDASLAFVHSNKFNSTNLAGFTSRGPTIDGRIKPDISAPGHTIYSTYSDGKAYSHQCGSQVGAHNTTLATMSGTSMATPITSGSAALVRQYFADGWLTHSHNAPAASVTLSAPSAADPANGFNVSSALVRAVLVNCAEDMQGYVQVGSGGGTYRIPAAPSFYQGYGRIAMSNTLCLASYSEDCSLFALDGPTLAIGIDSPPTPAPESGGGGGGSADCINNSTCLQLQPGWSSFEFCETYEPSQICVNPEWGPDMHLCCPLACGDCTPQDGRNRRAAAKAELLNDDSCQWSNDNMCDEPTYCTAGTDCSDCGNCGPAAAEPTAAPTEWVPTATWQDDNHMVRVTVPAGAKLKVTLTWTDPPGNPSAPHALVNDLDLSVTQVSNGATAIGNTGLYGPVGYPDNINNQEQVVLVNEADQSIDYDVRVQLIAQTARRAEQDFALVLASNKAGLIVKNNFTDATNMCPGDGNSQCSGNGECIEGICRCDAGFVGANCGLVSCPLDCSGNGVCNNQTGRCECAEQRFGPGCEFGQCGGINNVSIGADAPSAKYAATVMPASGDITGKGLDSGYGNDLNCVWNLQVPDDYFPEMKFDYFWTEQGYDFMRVFDSDGSELAKLDGDKSVEGVTPIVGSGNSLSVLFTSDSSAGAQGFKFWFEATKCTGGCSGHGFCQLEEVTGAQLPSSEEEEMPDITVQIGHCVCDDGYFGHNCEMDTTTAIPCEQGSNSSCSGHGSCTTHGVCDCDAGFSTEITDTQLRAVEQCSFQHQCALPYVETATNGSARVTSNQSPSGWAGECLFHIAAGDNSMTTYLAIADMAMGAGDSLIISYGSPKQRIVVPADSSTMDFTVPSGDVWIRFDVNGSYPLWNLMFYWETVATTEAPTGLPTARPSSDKSGDGDASTVNPTPSPAAFVRTQATGRVRLVGYINYDQIKDPGTASYRNFVNMFEADVEKFESARGRDTYCTVNKLTEGSVIVDFTLTVMLGHADAAQQGLADMQQAMLDGSMTRLAGAPLDTQTPLVTDGNCEVCPTCPTAAPFVTEPAVEPPTSAVPDCIDNSNDMRPKSITLGVFVGFGVLLFGGFILYGVCFLYRQTNQVEEMKAEVQLGAVAPDSGAPQEYGQILKDDDM